MAFVREGYGDKPAFFLVCGHEATLAADLLVRGPRGDVELFCETCMAWVCRADVVKS